jgi:hypothetical protein
MVVLRRSMVVRREEPSHRRLKESTMSETKSAAANVIPGVESVKKIYEDGASRVGQMFDDLGKGHTKWIEYGNTQIDEMSDLFKTQFNYVNDLAASWRKLSVDSVKKSLDTFSR